MSSLDFDQSVFRRVGTDEDRRDFLALTSFFGTASRFLSSGGSQLDA
jgi:hypothetical protein